MPPTSTQPDPPPPNPGTLSHALDAALAYETRVARRTRWITAATCWLALVLGIMALDALFRWGEVGRWIASGCWAAGALAWVCYVIRPSRGERQQATSSNRPNSRSLYAAASLEAHHGLADNTFINALWLEMMHQATNVDALSASLPAALRERSLAKAADLVPRVDTKAVADVQAYKRRRRELAGVLLLWLVVIVAMWRLPASELPRLMMPWQDRPAFSLTRFDVRLPDEALPIHSNYTLSVQLAGLLPERLEMVTLDEQGRPSVGRTADQLSPGRYQLPLYDLRQPLRFYLNADTGRSRVFTLNVRPPEAPKLSPTFTDPQNDIPSDAAAASQPSSATQPSLKDSGSAKDQPDVSAAVTDQRALIEALTKMLAEAKEAQRTLSQSSPADARTNARDVQTQTEALTRQSRDLQAQAQSALERTGPDALPTDARAILDQLAKTLGGLKTQSLPSLNDTASGASSWLGEAIAAGKADLAALSAHQGDTGKNPGQSPAESGRQTDSSLRDTPATPNPDGQLRTGVYQQTAGQKVTHEPPSSAARSRLSPPEYRAMVQQYFDRINQDQPDQKPPQTNPKPNTNPPAK